MTYFFIWWPSYLIFDLEKQQNSVLSQDQPVDQI